MNLSFMYRPHFWKRTGLLVAGGALLGLLTGCGGGGEEKKTEGEASGAAKAAAPLKVILQSDWYAQAEHGGYYQAVAKGYFAELGLDVEIQAGGPGSFGPQKVATGQAQFAMGRSDDLILAAQEGLPLVAVTALMQHDPQALLLHDENPAKTFADLDGKSIMAVPGAAWVEFLQRRYKIHLNIIPLNYGLAQFLSDPNFIQQCFITNEPFYVAQAGKKPRTLLIADSGYDPYRIIFSSQKFVREQPQAARAFAAAAARGWDDFLTGDPAPGMALIAASNDKMSEEFMRFSIAEMNRHRLVAGRPEKGERTGLITRERMEGQVKALLEIGLLRAPIEVDRLAVYDALPPLADAGAAAP
jgi:NitT/TauT family transport system substrate-binding protein